MVEAMEFSHSLFFISASVVLFVSSVFAGINCAFVASRGTRRKCTFTHEKKDSKVKAAKFSNQINRNAETQLSSKQNREGNWNMKRRNKRKSEKRERGKNEKVETGGRESVKERERERVRKSSHGNEFSMAESFALTLTVGGGLGEMQSSGVHFIYHCQSKKG